MGKLLIISVTWDTPENKVGDTIPHVTPNTKSSVVVRGSTAYVDIRW